MRNQNAALKQNEHQRGDDARSLRKAASGPAQVLR